MRGLTAAGRIVVGARICSRQGRQDPARRRKDGPDARLAVRSHRSPAQGRSRPCRYGRSSEVTSGLGATFDDRPYGDNHAKHFLTYRGVRPSKYPMNSIRKYRPGRRLGRQPLAGRGIAHGPFQRLAYHRLALVRVHILPPQPQGFAETKSEGEPYRDQCFEAMTAHGSEQRPCLFRRQRLDLPRASGVGPGGSAARHPPQSGSMNVTSMLLPIGASSSAA